MRRSWVLRTMIVLLGAGWATGANAADHLYVGSGSGVLPYSIAADGSITPVTCPQNVANCGPGLLWGVAASPNGKFVFGTLPSNGASNGSVAPFSVNADGSLSHVTCTGGSASCATEHQPEGLAVSPDGTYLFVANFNSKSISQFMIGPAGKLTPLTPPPSPRR
jgi:6-phosphogluconolactonase (cycloisomerase 2 family)